MNYELNDKKVIITGAARGIGSALVNGFLKQGAKVIAVDRNEKDLNDTIKTMSGNVIPVYADISIEKDVINIMDVCYKNFGGLDICVNNAAVAPHTALLYERVDVWDKVYAINCRGTFLVTKEAAKLMIKSNCESGRIINFSSGASLKGGEGSCAYASSRAAVESFSRCAAIELAPYNILVNSVSPGLIDTQVKPYKDHMAKSLALRIQALPLGRSGQADEVVEVVLFLSSKASSYITGSVYHVDGGSSIGSRATGLVIDDDIRYDWVTGNIRD